MDGQARWSRQRQVSVVVVKDATTGYQIRCPSTIKATLKGGTGLPGTGIGTVSSFTFGTCAGPPGFTYTLTLRHLPYTLNATSYNSSSGTTTAKIIGIHGTLEGSACSAVIDGTGAGADNGTLAINYANSTPKLKFLTTGGNLRFYQVVGCAGLIRSQDHLTLSGTGPVAPTENHQSVAGTRRTGPLRLTRPIRPLLRCLRDTAVTCGD
jgi:hypothetical protein